MPSSAGNSDGSRGYLWERFLILRVRRPVATAVVVGVPMGALLGSVVPSVFLGFLGTSSEAVLPGWLLAVIGSVGGAVFGLALGLILGALATGMGADRVVAPDCDPRRLRAARRALRRGELTDDAEANRLAVAVAQLALRAPFRPLPYRIFLLGFACLEGLALAFAVMKGNFPGVIFFGAFAAMFVGFATIGVQRITRDRMHSERVIALHAADAWSAGHQRAVTVPTATGP